jgi:hypothetical protein
MRTVLLMLVEMLPGPDWSLGSSRRSVRCRGERNAHRRRELTWNQPDGRSRCGAAEVASICG